MIDAPHVGHYHAPRAHIQVADLGIAHDARGQPDARARSFDERARVLLANLVVEGHPRERDCVAFARIAMAEAVENDERERPFLFEQNRNLPDSSLKLRDLKFSLCAPPDESNASP